MARTVVINGQEFEKNQIRKVDVDTFNGETFVTVHVTEDAKKADRSLVTHSFTWPEAAANNIRGEIMSFLNANNGDTRCEINTVGEGYNKVVS